MDGDANGWTNKEEDEFSENFDSTLIPVEDPSRQNGKAAKFYDKEGNPMTAGSKGRKYNK
jgi:hypothetical protein